MRYLSSARIRIPAGHALDIASRCGPEAHGHLYTVEVTWVREGFPNTDLDNWVLVREKVLDLGMELKNRSLNKMLGAQVPNAYGVASFFMERLSIHVPVIKVEVREDGDLGAVIERDDNY